MILLCYLLFIILGWTCTLEARVIHVPMETPMIQGGIAAAVDGDTVMVHPGRYTEYEIDFSGKAITVTGTDPEDPEIVASTIVDADSLGRVFYFHSGETPASILTGLTITGGHTDYWGGGIRCSNSSPTIVRNVISDNSSEFGGGGIWCENSVPMITHNLITGNKAEWGGGGIRCSGSSPMIRNNIISGNEADYGGGIDCHYSSFPRIVNNIITGNAAGSAGGIYCYDYSAPSIRNSTIVNNSAAYFGGALMSKGFSSPVIISSVLSGNTASVGEEIFIGGSEDSSSVTISYSLVEGGQGAVHVEPWCAIDWGDGMIDSDPMFIPGSFKLRSGSPCIDAGDPETVDGCRPPGLGEGRSDMGAYGGGGNCWWPTVGIFFALYPEGSLIAHRGDILTFHSYIFNRSGSPVNGDSWITVRLPDQNEVLVPPEFLNFPNPMSGRISAYGSTHLALGLTIPEFAETGIYNLFVRIGLYPQMTLDEETVQFQVIEDSYNEIGSSMTAVNPAFILPGRLNVVDKPH